MMKFFRKYTKHLLAIFMALLLVVWLGGSALTNMLRADQTRSDEVRGEMFGKPVTLGDMRPFSNETLILESLTLPWKKPWLLLTGNIDLRENPLDYNEWYMLRQATIESGIYVSPEAVENIKFQLSRIYPGLLESVRNNKKISFRRIDQIIESFLCINNMAALSAGAIKVSEADILNFIRDAFEKIRINVVSFQSQQFIDDSYQPTEDEIKEHFEEYKTTASQPGETLEFGYQLPEAVQIDYIKVKVNTLKDRQQISDDEAREYWKDHQTEFMKPTTQPATSPATQPKPEAPQPYTTATEALPDVITKLTENKAKAEALRIARELIIQLNRPWADSPTTQPYNYKQPPESETAEDIYPKLIARMEEKYSGVLEYSRTKLSDAKEISMIPGLGRAMFLPGTRQQLPFQEVAFMVAGLEANPKDDPGRARFYHNLYETCAEPAVDYDGNAYLIRTVAARPKQPPSSYQTVREKIIKDLRFKRAYEQAGKQAKEFSEKAGTMGLKEALENHPQLKEKLGERPFREIAPFARKRITNWGRGPQLMDGYVPTIGGDAEFIKKCFALADDKTATTTQPAHFLVHQLQQRQQWIVVQWLEKIPPTQEEYDKNRSTATDHIRLQRQMELLKSWFSPEQIRARVEWKDPPPPQSPQQPKEDEAAAEASEEA
ncbi:MAG: hypothetical protein JSV03_12475 [Planctomycetota bacterium]|nr:MAG: hypothetical protein JSV03_12475 [Planctomycetota bacterium]